MKTTLLTIMTVILTSCPGRDHTKDHFVFYNNSDRDVFVYLGVTPSELGGTLYPDTAISRERAGFTFKKGEGGGYPFSRFEAVGRGRNDTLSLYIYDLDTVNTYNWYQIRSGYKILKRYDVPFSSGLMRNLGHKISYPPTENMRDIKMYPAYGTE